MGSEVFPHKCIVPECTVTVTADNEPWCVTHSPESGSTLPGYSAKKASEQVLDLQERGNAEHRNVFEENG